MYEELGKFSRIDCLHVCDNLGDHMIGHVYANFSDDEKASDVLKVMNGRYYDGRQIEILTKILAVRADFVTSCISKLCRYISFGF